METTKSDSYQKYICNTCGFIYDELKGDPTNGIPPKTRFIDVPEEWICSMCGDPKSEFNLLDEGTLDNITQKNPLNTEDPIVVIGSGLSGWTVVAEIRKLDISTPIILITKESGDHYYKPLLSVSFSKYVNKEDLVTESAADKSNRYAVTLTNHTVVMGINVLDKKVITDKGIFRYRKLVIASGSDPLKPRQYFGENIFTVNSMEDYKRLNDQIIQSNSIVIIGAGLVGCELADDLSKTNKFITIINRDNLLLSNLVPEPIAEKFQELLEIKGVKIINNADVASLSSMQEHKTRIVLGSNEAIESDVVILCIGNKSNLGIARSAGINTGKIGICVNDKMQTNDPNIYAIGDCTEYQGYSLRYVDAIAAQAKVIAHSLSESESNICYQPKETLIKVKTQSYPIWIHSNYPQLRFNDWRVTKIEGRSMCTELLFNKKVIGNAYTGNFIQEIKNKLKPEFIGAENEISH